MPQRLFRQGAVILAGMLMAAGIATGTGASAASAAPAAPVASTARAASTTSVTPAAWTYARLKNVNSGMCLSVKGHSTAAGARTIQERCTGAHSQYWASPAGSSKGYDHLVNYHSGKCLAVNGSAKPVYQSPCNHNRAEDWYGRWRNSSHTQIDIVNRHTGLCLAVNGASKASGAPVIQWRCTTRPYERWTSMR